MREKTRQQPATQPVDNKQADAALLEVANRLRAARKAIAALLPMENARTDNLHADDDYIRKVIRSIEAKRRKLQLNSNKNVLGGS